MPVLNLYRSQVAELYAFAVAMNYRNLSGLKYCELQSSQLLNLDSATSYRTGYRELVTGCPGFTRDNPEPQNMWASALEARFSMRAGNDEIHASAALVKVEGFSGEESK